MTGSAVMRCFSMRCAASAASSVALTDLPGEVMTSRIVVLCTFDLAVEHAAQVAVGEHAEHAAGIDDHAHAEALLRHDHQALGERVMPGSTTGRSSPVRITSATCSSSLRPSAPPGCERAKSCGVKPRASSSATASASPIASVAVVLAVGARLSGQASSATLTSRWTLAARARFDFGLPVIAMTGTPRRDRCGISSSTSAVSPELEIASNTSSRVIMPMSPWLASAACMKNDGVPVEASVAAILPRDVAGLAHAADDDAPAALEADGAGARESRIEPRHQRRDRAALDLERPASGGDQRGRVGLELGIHAGIITLKIAR